jgi:fumarate reductase subunit D
MTSPFVLAIPPLIWAALGVAAAIAAVILGYFLVEYIVQISTPNPVTGVSPLSSWLSGIGNNVIYYVVVFGVAAVALWFVYNRLKSKAVAK